MTHQQLLKALRPFQDENRFEREPFDAYKARVGHLLPNWLDCPLKEWLHRHYEDAVRTYGWLPFDRISFERVTWTNDKIYNDVQTNKMKMVEGQGTQILPQTSGRRSTLQKMFLESGTWPVPIIVLENSSGMKAPDGVLLAQPYHLLEGHLRLGYFRNLYRQETNPLQEKHDVWLVRILFR